MNNKKIIAIAIGVAVLFGVGGFYGGVFYQKKKAAKSFSGRSMDGKMMEGLRGQGQRVGMTGGQNQGGKDFSDGEIISKDDKSLTVKTRDGGSKIVYFSAETRIGKTTEGTIADLAIGQQLMVNGKSNSDGSLTADNIQIRPAQVEIKN